MTKPKVRHLVGDARTLEFAQWSRWLSSAGRIVTRFDQELQDDPFAYNETASVSMLAAAAARTGFLGIAEFGVTKRHAGDLRKRADGRCDYWMQGDGRSWGFEFKQIIATPVTEANWRKARKAAYDCAVCLRRSEADVRVGALIVSLYWCGDDQREAQRRTLRGLATETDFAWELSAGSDASDTFLFFDLVP